MKSCFKCRESKPIAEFYAHKAMADGHLGKCKECTKRDMAVARRTNPKVRVYDRERAKRPSRIALRRRVCAEWKARHPERARAHMAARYALRSGLIARPIACQSCGNSCRLEMHHEDYARPVDVRWLCKPCHAVADKARRAIEAEVRHDHD